MPCMSVAISVSFVCPGRSQAMVAKRTPTLQKAAKRRVLKRPAALKNKATFYPFPDPRRGKVRSALYSASCHQEDQSMEQGRIHATFQERRTGQSAAGPDHVAAFFA